MNRKAVIFGIQGIKLTSAERSFLKKEKPWGIILFSRNIKDLFQLKFLINDIKKNINDNNYPILIDQEGGKVSRLNKILDLSFFSANFFGKFYTQDKKKFFHYYKIYTNGVCEILKKVGININTVPVLDVLRKNSHSVILKRSFSDDPLIVSKIGKLCIKLHQNNKIATVIKHIPGHGLAKSDSHKNLPIIKAKKKELIKNDFKTFKTCKSLFAMTAHIIYGEYDPTNAATQSKIVTEDVIRKHIGFNGILISDDITMRALKHGLIKNSKKALDAGCNLILHCNGNIKEMAKLVKIIPNIDKFTQKKTAHFYNFLR